MGVDGEYLTGRWYYRKALRQADVARLTDLGQHVLIKGITTRLGVLVTPDQSSTGMVTVLTVSGVGMMTLPSGFLQIPGLSPPLRGAGSIWPYFSVHKEPIENVYLLDSPDPTLKEALSRADQYFRSRPTAEGRVALKDALKPVDLFFVTQKGAAEPPGKAALGALPLATKTWRASLQRLAHPLDY